MGRLIQIGLAAVGLLGWWSLVWAHVLRSKLTPAQRLCGVLDRLGATFRKLGQMLSLRHDLLPEEVVTALQGLQDRADPFPSPVAEREIERELGRRIGELFAEFDETPLAAASVAQVHRARMLDGRPVVVKVRRPGIKSQVAQDMRILRWVVRAFLPLFPDMRRYQPLELVQEMAVNLQRELDFRQEARHVQRFSEMFRDSETIYVPELIDGLAAEAVLVQALSGGLRIDDPAVLSHGPQLAAALVDAYLEQYFVHGVFHGDPHPGNLFVRADGRLCLHDFGLVGRLDRLQRRNLAVFMQAFVHQDADWLLDAFLDLGILGGDLDRREFRRGLEDLLGDYSLLPLKDWSFSAAFIRIARMGRGQNIRIPHDLLVLMRTMVLVESAVRTLDPNYNLLEGMMGRADEVMKRAIPLRPPPSLLARIQNEAILTAQVLPQALLEWVRRTRTGGIGWGQGLRDFEAQLDRSSNRLSLSIVTLGLYIASSILMQHSLGPRWKNTPILAIAGYLLALWSTWKLFRTIAASEHRR